MPTSGIRAHDQEARCDQDHGAEGHDPARPSACSDSLREELAQVAPRLQDTAADPALHPGAHLTHQADEQRRQDHHAVTWTTPGRRRRCSQRHHDEDGQQRDEGVAEVAVDAAVLRSGGRAPPRRSTQRMPGR